MVQVGSTQERPCDLWGPHGPDGPQLPLRVQESLSSGFFSSGVASVLKAEQITLLLVTKQNDGVCVIRSRQDAAGYYEAPRGKLYSTMDVIENLIVD